MNTGPVVKLSFVAGLVLTVVGGWLKITREPVADSLLLPGLLLTAVFLVTVLYEVLTSRRIPRSEKALWVMGFLVTGFLAGLFYLLSERKRIVAVA